MAKRLVVKWVESSLPVGGAHPVIQETTFSPWIRVIAPSTNGGLIFVGDEDVSDSGGYPSLAAGESIEYRHGNAALVGPDQSVAFDLQDFHFSSDTDGDTVIIEYFDLISGQHA